MRCLNDLNGFAGRTIAIARNDNTFDWCVLTLMPLGPCPLESRRHLRRALTRTDHNRPALRLGRQIGADHQFRISSSNRCIEQAGQKLLRIGDGGHEIPDFVYCFTALFRAAHIKAMEPAISLQITSSMFSPPEKSNLGIMQRHGLPCVPAHAPARNDPDRRHHEPHKS
ncbi:hypothetical protein D3C80_990920 [compost metagenome]